MLTINLLVSYTSNHIHNHDVCIRNVAVASLSWVNDIRYFGARTRQMLHFVHLAKKKKRKMKTCCGDENRMETPSRVFLINNQFVMEWKRVNGKTLIISSNFWRCWTAESISTKFIKGTFRTSNVHARQWAIWCDNWDIARNRFCCHFFSGTALLTYFIACEYWMYDVRIFSIWPCQWMRQKFGL